MTEIDLAREYFHQSADHDRFPPHITSAYRDVIRRVTSDAKIELLDAAEILRQISPSGLLDRSVIQDYVHPTLQGYHALAIGDFRSETVRECCSITADAQAFSFEEMIQRIGFKTDDLATAYKRTAWCLNSLAGFRVNSALLLQESQQYELWSQQLSSGEIQPGEDGTEGFTNDSPPGIRFPHF